MALCKECSAELNEAFPFCVACGAKISEPVAEKAVEVADTAAEPDTATKIFDAAIPTDQAPCSEEAVVEEVAPADGATEETDEDVTIFVPEKKKNSAAENTEIPMDAHDEKKQAKDEPSKETDPQLPLGKQSYKGKPDKKGEYGVVGTPYYFLISLLYLIPIVGLIMTIVMSFGGTVNQNKCHFARCVLIYKLIAVLALFAGVILAILFKEDVLAFCSTLFGRELVAWQDMIDMFLNL